MEASEILAQSIDKSQVPPLHQKRILAFVNHFLISSCSFLNEFALKCETKFIELERKMQKVEAALTIIEAKLASIPDTEVTSPKEQAVIVAPTSTAEIPAQSEQHEADSTQPPSEVEVEVVTPPDPPAGVRACDDIRYKKFFKMVQFGVPARAVKIKMESEGVEPNILDTPNLMLADGITS